MPLNGNPVRWNYDGNFSCTFTPPTDNYTRTFNGILTNSRTYTFPDKSGTFAMTSDVPTGANGGLQLIGVLKGADMNTKADQLITLTGGTKFVPVDIVVSNASKNLTTAAGLQVWTGVNKTGIQFVNSATGLVNLTTSSKYINFLTNGAVTVIGTDTIGTTVYLSLGTPQGSTATADVYIYAYILV